MTASFAKHNHGAVMGVDKPTIPAVHLQLAGTYEVADFADRDAGITAVAEPPSNGEGGNGLTVVGVAHYLDPTPKRRCM